MLVPSEIQALGTITDTITDTDVITDTDIN